MLEEVRVTESACGIHRYANPRDMLHFLEEQGFDRESKDEMFALLKERSVKEGTEQLLDEPFLPKRHFKPAPSRFSDSSHPVFYAAMESETACAEVSHWYIRRIVGEGRTARTAYYRHIVCFFNGRINDLRPKATDWPLLAGPDRDTAYPFCNRLGAEAVAAGLDAFYTPSARKQGGTCVQVFRRASLSAAKEESIVTLTFRQDTGMVHAHAQPDS